MPTLKIKDIKPEYAAKEVRDASGNVLSWDQVLKYYPDYEIEVDNNGKPLQYKSTPAQDYRLLENIVENDPNGPYAATKWLLGQQVALPLGALGVVTAPAAITVGGIAGGVGGDILGNYASDWLFNNPDKEYKLNQDITITPRTATRLVGSLVGGIAGGAGAYTTQQNVVKPYLISREIKRMPLTGSDELPSNVGWGPKQTITVSHKSDSPKPLVLLNPERYDAVNEGANPLGIWYQGKLGIPRTVNTGATKAQRARKLFDDRPFTHKGDLTLEKPLVTIGEVPNRSTLSHQAEKLGADGIMYNGVYDNGYKNNQVILSFKQHNNPHLGIKAYRGGNPNGFFFSTDPNYASQYGTLRQYDLIARNPEITETPLLFPKDVVAQDMYIDDLIKGDYSKDVIIGKDAITNEGLTPSTGYELIVRNPDNITGTQKKAIENLKSYSINSSNLKSNYLDDNGNWDMSKIKEELKSGKKDLIDWIKSEEYRIAAEANVREAEKMGLKYIPTYEYPAFKEFEKFGSKVNFVIEPDNNAMGWVGTSSDSPIVINLPNAKNIRTVEAHEAAHKVRHGWVDPNHPELDLKKQMDYLRYKNGLIFDESASDLTTETGNIFYNFGTKGFPHEAAANLRDLGKMYGIKITDKYPGPNKVRELLKTMESNASEGFQKKFIKALKKDDASLENVWKALNGTFYTLTGAAMLGIPYVYAKKSGGSLIPKHQIGTIVQDKYYRFCGPMYHALYKAFKNVGKVSENQAMQLARYATYQMANESGYGTSRLAREQHNYGGMKNGNKGWQKFNSMEDFANQFVRNQMKNFKETLGAQNYDDYIDGLFDYQYQYAPDEGKELYNSNLQGVQSRVDSNIDKYINRMSKFYKPDIDLNSDNLIFKTRSTIYDKPM